MGCLRGKANPTAQTKLQLFADSGGHCQNPNCLVPLFNDIKGEKFHIAEIAHIIAANDFGPRAVKLMTAAERGSYSNLILLCPTCHTKIDKAPVAYPDSIIRQWKIEHKILLVKTFAIHFKDRASARSAIESLLLENRIIHAEYGPDLEHKYDPETDAVDVWHRKMLTRIIPNNRRILLIIDANRNLLTAREAEVLERFRQHVFDLEAKHLESQTDMIAKKFPPDMEEVFKV